MARNILDLAEELKKRLRQVNISDVLPPVAAYKAVKQVTSPQYRQQVNKALVYNPQVNPRLQNVQNKVVSKIQSIPTFQQPTGTRKYFLPEVATRNLLNLGINFGKGMLESGAQTAIAGSPEENQARNILFNRIPQVGYKNLTPEEKNVMTREGMSLVFGGATGEGLRSTKSAETTNLLSQAGTRSSILPQSQIKSEVSPAAQTTLSGILDEVKGIVYSGDKQEAKKLYDSISGSKPTFESIVNEVEKIQKGELGEAVAVSKDQFGQYQKIVNNFKSFLSMAGEKKSTKTGELFREHIPVEVFGMSSDEVANALGKSETEFMQEITKDLNMVGSGKSTPQVVSRLKSNVNKIENLYNKLDTNKFTINKDELGRITGVNFKPDVKELENMRIMTKEKAKLFQEKKDYNSWKKQVFGESQARTTTQAVNDLSKQIKSSTNIGFLDMADNWKDKPKLSYARETMERNFEDIMGADARTMKDKFLQPVYEANKKIVQFKNKERAEIKALGIKPRSKESALVQQLGEGQITEAELRSTNKSAEKIINAEKVLRQKYDQYLETLNKVLERNGYDPVPKRKDYFHHFQDLEGAFEQFGVAIKASDLPTDVNGLTADFKPGRTFFSATLPRNTEKTSVDAITGIDKYLDGLANQVYQTDNIQRLRSFENAIREKYAGTKHLTNFAAELTEYTNKLAGKKAMVDRAAEALVGRKIYSLTQTLKKQVGSNMVGANISSALTNYIPITQTLATTDKQSVVQALYSIIQNTFKNDGFIDDSAFLTSRIGSDRLALTKWEKIGDKAGWLFKTIDNFTSQLAVRSKYLEGLKKGLSEKEALKLADEWGRKTLAGRSPGEMPTLFNSQTLGLLTQFQLEVNNQMSFMLKDIPRANTKLGAASATAQLIIYSYLFNDLYEKLTGRRPAIDPLGVGVDTYEDYKNPNIDQGQLAKNTLRRVQETLPFTSITSGGRIPLGSALPNVAGILTGEADLLKEVEKPFFYLLPVAGGGQIKKTLEGTQAYQKGASLSPSGRVRFPIPQTLFNRIRTTLFGQGSTPEAQTYFREGRSTLGPKQSESFFKATNPVDFYNQIISKRQKAAQEKKTTEVQNVNIAQAAEGPLPTIPADFEALYKDAQKTIDGYADLSAKIRTGLKDDMTLEEAQTQLVEAKNLIRRMEQENPSLVLDVGINTYKSGGSKSVKERSDWIVKQMTITQGFGNYNPSVELSQSGINYGTDLRAGVGTPIIVPDGNWKVVESYSGADGGRYANSGYGNSITVRNLDTNEQLKFSHLSATAVKAGETLTGGIIGLSGATGNTYGAHLDVEYRDSSGKLSDVSKSKYGTAFAATGDYQALLNKLWDEGVLTTGKNGTAQYLIDNYGINPYSYTGTDEDIQEAVDKANAGKKISISKGSVNVKSIKISAPKLSVSGLPSAPAVPKAPTVKVAKPKSIKIASTSSKVQPIKLKSYKNTLAEGVRS